MVGVAVCGFSFVSPHGAHPFPVNDDILNPKGEPRIFSEQNFKKKQNPILPADAAGPRKIKDGVFSQIWGKG